MNSAAIGFAAICGCAILALPRRWAALPLLVGACYMTVGEKVELGPFSFTVLRLVIAAGVIRATLRREKVSMGVNHLDCLVLGWGLWTVASSALHHDLASTIVARLGSVYNAWGIYFLLRIFCSSPGDITRLAGASALVLVPVALAMTYEHAAFYNVFSIFGGVSDVPAVREGQVRASGPFAHPILAGSVGGVMLPLMITLWQEHRITSIVGIVACLTMVVTSGSSGPVMSAVTAAGAVMMWPFRRRMRVVRWAAAAAFLTLTIAMNRPPYYVIQKMEVFGGSTGWYRSRLIEVSLEHIDEWWLGGTDYTRHWMPESNAINEHHTDITNQYLAFCIEGGLPLLLLHLLILVTAFRFVGREYAESNRGSPEHRFISWALGCALLAHAVTTISVSYFDQSFLFFYLNLAAIAGLRTLPQIQRNSHVSRLPSHVVNKLRSTTPRARYLNVKATSLRVTER